MLTFGSDRGLWRRSGRAVPAGPWRPTRGWVTHFLPGLETERRCSSSSSSSSLTERKSRNLSSCGSLWNVSRWSCESNAFFFFSFVFFPFFVALPVSTGLLSENALKDPRDWEAAGQSDPGHQGHGQLPALRLQRLPHAFKHTVYRKCNVYHCISLKFLFWKVYCVVVLKDNNNKTGYKT